MPSTYWSLFLSPSVGLIVARIRRSGTKCVYISDASTIARYVSRDFARNLGSTFVKYKISAKMMGLRASVAEMDVVVV